MIPGTVYGTRYPKAEKTPVQNTESAIREGRYFTYSASKQKLMSDLIDRYIEEIIPLKPQSGAKQEKQLEVWKSQIGHLRIEEATTSVIYGIRSTLKQGKTIRGSVRSNATVNRYMAALSHAFTIAINEWEWLHDNPCRRISRLPEGKGRNRFLDETEKSRLLNFCKQSTNQYLYTVVVLAISTGARRNEILSLTWKDVHFDREVIVLKETKNGDVRVIPIQGYALKLLKELYRLRAKDPLFIFPSENSRWRPVDITTAWSTALKRACIEDFRFHDLRHTAASYLAMSGASMKEIADILGHKTLQITQRYAHLSEAHTKKVVAGMNDKMFESEVREYDINNPKHL